MYHLFLKVKCFNDIENKNMSRDIKISWRYIDVLLYFEIIYIFTIKSN